MLTFTFAGDEAGDVSFSFHKGASRYFVMAVIATPEPDELRGVLEKVRQEAGLPPGYEFGFHALTAAQLRQRVFLALGAAKFDAWALVVDKTQLPDVYRLMSGMDVYLYFVSELLRAIPAEIREGGTLILDEFGLPEQVRTELRRIFKARGISHGFRRISIRRSKSEQLIQIADLVAGAIFRRDAHNESGAFDSIAGKIKQVVEYRP